MQENRLINVLISYIKIFPIFFMNGTIIVTYELEVLEFD